MSHTPGPWEVAADDRNGQAVVRAEHIEVATCWHHCVGSIEKEMRANARLIAAAPELLAALIHQCPCECRHGSMTDDFGNEREVEDVCQRCAAIAKAEGK